MKSGSLNVLVVGSGIAGLRTATALADMGLPVTLVERAQRPGGHAAEWACMATDTCAKCSACLVQDQIGKAIRHPQIRVILGAEVNSVTGTAGDYRLALSPATGANGQRLAWPGLQLTESQEITGGAVVMATGFDTYSAAASPMLNYGRLEGVTTTQDLDEVLREDNLSSFLPEGESSPRLAFIQCVGSRDRQRGRQYCSQFCCQTTIRLARRLRHFCPELEITVFYIDLQVMSKEFVTFYQQARDEGIDFQQGVPAEIIPGEERALRVFGVPSGSAQAVPLEFDRIVLAIGLAPTASHPALAQTLGIELNQLGYFPTNGSGRAKGNGRSGVFFVGGCAGPTDIQGSCKQALAVATQVAGVVRTTSGDPELTVTTASATTTR
jgi:heterodisulfide reductase subunit A2